MVLTTSAIVRPAAARTASRFEEGPLGLVLDAFEQLAGRRIEPELARAEDEAVDLDGLAVRADRGRRVRASRPACDSSRLVSLRFVGLPAGSSMPRSSASNHCGPCGAGSYPPCLRPAGPRAAWAGPRSSWPPRTARRSPTSGSVPFDRRQAHEADRLAGLGQGRIERPQRGPGAGLADRPTRPASPGPRRSPAGRARSTRRPAAGRWPRRARRLARAAPRAVRPAFISAASRSRDVPRGRRIALAGAAGVRGEDRRRGSGNAASPAAPPAARPRDPAAARRTRRGRSRSAAPPARKNGTSEPSDRGQGSLAPGVEVGRPGRRAPRSRPPRRCCRRPGPRRRGCAWPGARPAAAARTGAPGQVDARPRLAWRRSPAAPGCPAPTAAADPVTGASRGRARAARPTPSGRRRGESGTMTEWSAW